MAPNRERHPVILVVEDVEETRRGIERLLTTDGYTVCTATDEDDAVHECRGQAPDLVLMCLDRDAVQLVAIAERIRDRSGLGAEVPVVLFCVAIVEEGAEVEVFRNIYMTRPDNFDQLRVLLSRLLRKPSGAG